MLIINHTIVYGMAPIIQSIRNSLVRHCIHPCLYSRYIISKVLPVHSYTQIMYSCSLTPSSHKQMDLVGTLLAVQGQQFTTDSATVLCNLP